MKICKTIEHDSKIMSVRVSGTLTTAELAKHATQARIKALESCYGLVLVFAGINIQVSISELYFWFSDHYDPVDNQLRRVPTAHVVDEMDYDFFRTIETMWVNQGINTRLFKQESAARDWLKSAIA